jgi:PAS domain S-box-containing protein
VKVKKPRNRKTKPDHLEVSEDLYRSLYENVHDGIYRSTSEGRILNANPALVRMLGYDSEEDLKSKNIGRDIYVSPVERDRLVEQINNRGRLADAELLLKRKDGSHIIVLENSRSVFSKEGKMLFYEGTLTEITQLKRATENLELRLEQLRQIIDLVPSYIFAKDIDGKFLLANKALADVFGLSPDEIQGKNDSDYGATHEQIEWYRKHDLEVLRNGMPVNIPEEQVMRKDGTLGWFQTVKIPYKHPGYPKPAILGVATEITERKSIETDLIKAKEKAEESDRLKTAFLHNISHEIRTPMNAIVGFTTLLETPGLPEDTHRQYVDIIYNSSIQLLAIISDIVDISNIETGHVKLSGSKINLKSLMVSLFDQYSPRAKQAGLNLNFQTVPASGNYEIMTDETKLVQIISNLLNNSLKFTANGSISFGFEMKVEKVEFFVRDTGKGIKAEEKEKIFDRFFQSDDSENIKTEGTGLGLAICKGLVELMGGRIWVVSEPGKGSEFRFGIPVIRPAPEKETPSAKNHNTRL